MKKMGARQFFGTQKCTQNIPKVTQKKEREAHTQLIKNLSNQKPWSGEMIEDHGV